MDDDRLDEMLAEMAERPEHETIDRRVYFKELFNLQRELVKLQDWVQFNKEKIVVIFEGRDSAGKGGVIKRITQRLNPRICRVAALPAPSERERTQWYFQRYVSHLPAGGEIVLFDRSWYNRAGVERVMGFCDGCPGRGVLPRGARIRAHAGALRHPGGQILVFDHRRGAAFPLPDAHPRSAEAVETVADGRASPACAGRPTPRPRRRCCERTNIPEAPWWVVEAVDKKTGAAQLHRPPALRFPHEEIKRDLVVLPARVRNPDYPPRPCPGRDATCRRSIERSASRRPT